ncbi:MAG: trimethylamine methyltransferase family protein [Planctomycetota bacterium]
MGNNNERGPRHLPPSGGSYRPLSSDQIGRIHETALRVLEEVGVRVESPRIRAIYTDNGCSVDSSGDRVLLPPEVVEHALADAPDVVTLWSRDGSEIELSGNRIHFGTGGAATQVLDIETGEKRPSRARDNYELALLADQLPEIDFFVRPASARDISDREMAVNEFYASMSGTRKHVMGAPYNPAGVRKVTELGEVLAGGHRELSERPFLSFILTIVRSPLHLDRMGGHTLVRAVRQGVPITISCPPMMGFSAPLTLAGTLTQLHAEEMAGLSLAQMIRPGAPVIYGGVPSVTEMHRVRYLAGAVEFGMMNAAVPQLSRYIGIPNYNSAGATEAKQPDIQAVYEKSFSLLQCALSGSNCIHHAAGMLESLLTVSAEQIIIDHELIQLARRAVEGVEVNEDTLAFDAIREGVAEGNFLSLDHTIEHLREEIAEPVLAERGEDEDRRTINVDRVREKANKRAKTLLKRSEQEDFEPPIPSDKDAEIRERFSIHFNR